MQRSNRQPAALENVTSGAAERGPQSGVNYFGDTGTSRGAANLNPGQAALSDEAAPPDAGLNETVRDGAGGYGGPSVTDAGLAGAYASGERDSVVGQFGKQVASLALGAVAPGLGSAIGPGLSMGEAAANPGFYSGPAAAFSAGSPEAQNARAYAEAETARLGLPARESIDQMAAAREADALGAFMSEQSITPSYFSAPTTAVGVMADPYAAPPTPAATGGGGGGAGLSMPGAGFTTSEFGTFADGAERAPGSYVDREIGETGPRGQGGYGGGYGGGVGQSGGNASGMGSHQAADGGMATTDGFQRPAGLTAQYADGGMVGGAPLLAMGFNQGGGVRMGAQPDGQQIMGQVNQMLRNPQVVQQIMGNTQQLMASGELTPDEVQMMGRIAEAAAMNPSLYPQLRAFVQQQGMSPLPPAFDPSAVVKIIAISRVLSQGQGGQPQGQPGQPMQPGGPGATPPGQVPGMDQARVQAPGPGMANGGFISGPGTGRSDSIGTVNESVNKPVKVANEEYIIPAHVVRAKGREFFDNLLRRYSDVGAGE